MPASRKRKKGETYKVLWFTLRVCGQSVAVWVWDDYPDDGGYSPTESTINVVRSTKDRMHDTLIHELAHAILDCSGSGYLLRDKLGMSAREWDKFEECIIRALTPGIFATYGDAGFLKLPKVPR